MLLALLASICFKRNYRLEQTTSIWRLAKRWRFGSGGEYSIKVSSMSPERPFFVGLLTVGESGYMTWYGTRDWICSINASQAFGVATTLPGAGEFNGVMESSGAYDLWWTACSESESDYVSYTLDIKFKNPNTLLSLDEYPMVYGTPIVTALIGVFLILWFVNWFMNFSLENKLHLLFSIAYVITFVYYIVCCLKVNYEHKSDDPSNLPMAMKVMRVIQETFLLSVMTLAAEGWYIIRPTIKWYNALICVVLSIAVCVPAAVLEWADLSLWGGLVCIFVFAVTGVLFYLNMLRHVRRARKEVMAHLVVIQEQGINPTTTPVYKKYSMFKSLAVVVLSYFLLLFTRSIVLSAWTLPEWIVELTYYIILSALMIVVGFFFKMKKETKRGYFMIDAEGEDARVFSLSDVDGMRLNDLEGQTWSEDMALPSQPIIDFSNQNQPAEPLAPTEPPAERDTNNQGQ